MSLLTIGHVYSGNTNHFSASYKGPGLTLALGMPGIDANDAHNTLPLNHAASITSRLNRRSHFQRLDLPGLYRTTGFFKTAGST